MAIIYPPRFGGFLVVFVRARMLRMIECIKGEIKTPRHARGFEKLNFKQKLPSRFEKLWCLCCEIDLHGENITIYSIESKIKFSPVATRSEIYSLLLLFPYFQYPSLLLCEMICESFREYHASIFSKELPVCPFFF